MKRASLTLNKHDFLAILIALLLIALGLMFVLRPADAHFGFAWTAF